MLSIRHTTYPDLPLKQDMWLRYVAMRCMDFNSWAEQFNNRCYNSGGVLKFVNWRVVPHYKHGGDEIVDVELWKGINDYPLSFEEKAILVKILKEKL